MLGVIALLGFIALLFLLHRVAASNMPPPEYVHSHNRVNLFVWVDSKGGKHAKGDYESAALALDALDFTREAIEADLAVRELIEGGGG